MPEYDQEADPGRQATAAAAAVVVVAVVVVLWVSQQPSSCASTGSSLQLLLPHWMASQP